MLRAMSNCDPTLGVGMKAKLSLSALCLAVAVGAVPAAGAAAADATAPAIAARPGRTTCGGRAVTANIDYGGLLDGAALELALIDPASPTLIAQPKIPINSSDRPIFSGVSSSTIAVSPDCSTVAWMLSIPDFTSNQPLSRQQVFVAQIGKGDPGKVVFEASAVIRSRQEGKTLTIDSPSPQSLLFDDSGKALYLTTVVTTSVAVANRPKQNRVFPASSQTTKITLDTGAVTAYPAMPAVPSGVAASTDWGTALSMSDDGVMLRTRLGALPATTPNNPIPWVTEMVDVVHGRITLVPQFTDSSVASSLSPDRTRLLTLDFASKLTEAFYAVHDAQTGALLARVTPPTGCAQLSFVAADRLICVQYASVRFPEKKSIPPSFLVLDLTGKQVAEVGALNPLNIGQLVVPK
jgi:hypothetical protein